MIKIVLIVLLAEIFAAAGHLFFKKSTNALEMYSLNGIDANKRFLKDILTRPSIWCGLLFMLISMIIWLFALTEGNLSIVFSIGSMQYILILFLAHVFLGEKIDKMKLIGTFLVVFGIILITLNR